MTARQIISALTDLWASPQNEFLESKPPFIMVLSKAHWTFPSAPAPVCHVARLSGRLPPGRQGNAKKLGLPEGEGVRGLPSTHSPLWWADAGAHLGHTDGQSSKRKSSRRFLLAYFPGQTAAGVSKKAMGGREIWRKKFNLLILQQSDLCGWHNTGKS